MADKTTTRRQPVRAFLGRLGVQIVVSGSAMAAIHAGMRVMPDLDTLFGREPLAIASVQAPPAPQPAVFLAQTSSKGERLPPPSASENPAPARPFQTAGLERPSARSGSVQRFDACDPACPSRDPLLHAKPALSLIPVADRGTDFAERLDDGLRDRPGSLLSVPGRALGAAGRKTADVWNRVETLLPF